MNREMFSDRSSLNALNDEFNIYQVIFEGQWLSVCPPPEQQ